MKRSSCAGLLALFALVLCLSAAAAAWVGLVLPQRAAQAFGPPSPRLDFIDRAYLSARLLRQEQTLKTPANPDGAPLPFQVGLGEPTYAITNRLQAAGIILDAQALRDYLVYTGLDASLQAGEYSLSPRQTPIQIALALQDATPREVTFRILPGWRMEEVAAALPTSGLEFTPPAFLALAGQPPPGLTPAVEGAPPGATLEGFLFPDSYRIPRQASPQQFLETILANFQLKITPKMRQGFGDQGLSLYQAVTLASIVQREAILEDEMPTIASVFFNRLANGMRLDSDPTVQYALGYNPAQETWWTNPLDSAHLALESPYNTYLHPGLPPAPIASPGLAALQAVAFPAQSPYYYFRAACDGSGRHNFARTFAEHQQNACP
ncbi:MAG: endolytic transglycosylase MltG [Chloroflexota bacterium]